MTNKTVANVKPTGQARQKTGYPKINELTKAASKIMWRLSKCTPLLLPHFAAHVAQAAFVHKRLRPLIPFLLGDIKCTGHIHEQKTLPRNKHIINAAIMLTIATGKMVFFAIIENSAPKGQINDMSPHPKPHVLPMPPAVK